MTILMHADSRTECDRCDQPIGASRAMLRGHVVCQACAGRGQAAPADGKGSFQDQIADAMGLPSAIGLPNDPAAAAPAPAAPALPETSKHGDLAAAVADEVERQYQASGNRIPDDKPSVTTYAIQGGA